MHVRFGNRGFRVIWPSSFRVMDIKFMNGSMGSVVGEKATRLIELATNLRIPLILICASRGARIQEGIFSLIQMAKITSALHAYKETKNSVYIAVLTSPTSGSVAASFAMLGDMFLKLFSSWGVDPKSRTFKFF